MISQYDPHHAPPKHATDAMMNASPLTMPSRFDHCGESLAAVESVPQIVNGTDQPAHAKKIKAAKNVRMASRTSGSDLLPRASCAAPAIGVPHFQQAMASSGREVWQFAQITG